MSLKKYSSIPIHIVEDHCDALKPLLRAVATKHLPFTSNLMIHFDSHPDMLIPANLRSEDVFHKDTLFDVISIENWILPAVFAGHFDTIVWIKPPWSNQIPNGKYQFSIGVEKDTGYIKVSCDLLYFVSETLYCPESDLENKKDVILYVMTLGDECFMNDTPLSTSSTGNNSLIKNASSSPTQTLQESIDILLKLISNHNDVFVLDIDLDFFTTLNPFINMHENVQLYDRLQSIYAFEIDLLHGKTMQDNQNRRKNQLSTLKKYFSSLQSMKISEIQSNLPSLLEKISDLGVRTQLESLVLDLVNSIEKESSCDLKNGAEKLSLESDMYQEKNDFIAEKESKKIKLESDVCIEKNDPRTKKEPVSQNNRKTDVINKEEERVVFGKKLSSKETCDSIDPAINLIDWELIHDAGCTWDSSTQVLPHHPSTDEEIDSLFKTFESLSATALTAKPPILITMARSSLDNYCPPEKVDAIQERVASFFTGKFSDVKRYHLY